jgi:hypothetical protein
MGTWTSSFAGTPTSGPASTSHPATQTFGQGDLERVSLYGVYQHPAALDHHVGSADCGAIRPSNENPKKTSPSGLAVRSRGPAGAKWWVSLES